MIDEKLILLITDMANEDINRTCPSLEQDVKPYMTRAVLRASENLLKIYEIAKRKIKSEEIKAAGDVIKR